MQDHDGWLCDWKIRYFHDKKEVKCLMCWFIKDLLKIFEQNKENNFDHFKQLYEKYMYQFNFVDDYFDYDCKLWYLYFSKNKK